MEGKGLWFALGAFAGWYLANRQIAVTQPMMQPAPAPAPSIGQAVGSTVGGLIDAVTGAASGGWRGDVAPTNAPAYPSQNIVTFQP